MDAAGWLDLLHEGVATIAVDGALLPRNRAAAGLLARLGAATLSTLPLDADDRRRLDAGEAVPVPLADGGHCTLRRGGGPDGPLVLSSDDALQAAEAQARAGERARRLALLARAIVHDLGNHFGVGLGLAEQLLPMARDGEERRLIAVMQQGVRQGDALLKALALMLQKSPRQRRRIGLAAVVRDVLLLVQKSALKSGRNAQADVRDESLQVRVVAEDLMSALVFGCTAALSAMPAGGMLTLEVDSRRVGRGDDGSRRMACVALRGAPPGACQSLQAAVALGEEVRARGLPAAAADHVPVVMLLRRAGGDLRVEADGTLLYLLPASGGER